MCDGGQAEAEVPRSISVFFFGLVVGLTLGTEVPLVRFQTGEHDTVNSYLNNGTDFPNLTQFSLCVHIKYLHMAQNNTLLSYFSEGQDNELSLFTNNLDVNTIQLYCCGDRVRNYLYYPIRLYTWEHFCITVDLKIKKVVVVVNNDFREYPLRETNKDNTKPLLIRGGGRLVLGQDLDSPDGGFNIEQILPCEIADLVMYDVVLSRREIESFMSCRKEISYSPILYADQNMTVLTAVGDTEVTSVSEKALCADMPGYKLLFPERVTFWGNVAWCEMLKGAVVLPKNEEENTEVFDKFYRFRDECSDRWRTFYYFGTIRNVTTDEWFSYEDDTLLVYEKFDTTWNSIVKDYECAAVGNQFFKYTWFAIPCTSSMCSACNFTTSPRLRLRGLCKESLIDRSFFLHDYYNNRPLFDGEIKNRIFWNNRTWEIRSRQHPSLVGLMDIQSPKEYPLGRHTWDITGDKCSKTILDLQLTSCSEGEYTCNSGSCISKDRRCDLVTDCPDLSDELDCDVVNVPEGYSSALPPPKISSGPLALLFSVRIISIREFNLVGFTLVVDAVVTVKWHDSRLVFRNLRDDYHANKVKDFSQLWTPNIFIRDGSRSSVDENLRSKDVYVMLEDEALPNDDTLVGEDDTYSGRNNTLVMETEQTLKFTCQFLLQMYPVDTQNCFLLFTIPDLNKDFGVLVKDVADVKFEGSRRLLEYELMHEMLTEETEGRTTYMQVLLRFENLYGYYVGNTFVPSLLLTVIAYLTLYFGFDDFQDRVMVSLTSLLVLATFFTQTSATIPRTSYLKLIDAWYVALICKTFLVIVSLVVVENLRLMEEDQPFTTKVVPVGQKGSIKPSRSLYVKMNLTLRILFPIILFVILTAFFSFWSKRT